MAVAQPTPIPEKPVFFPKGRRGQRVVKQRMPALIEALRKGHYLQDAAHLVGIHERTAQRWIARGKEAADRIAEGHTVSRKEKMYAEFFMEAGWADAQCTDEIIGQIKAQIPTQWVAGITFLERRHPDKWRRRETFEHTGPEGAPLQTVPSDNARVIAVLNVLVDNRLLPAGIADTLRQQLAGPVIDAHAQPVHPTHPNSEAAGSAVVRT